MRKTQTKIHFQKKYCLLLHTVTSHQKLSLATLSQHSADTEIIDRICTYSLNQLLYINCIEAVIDGVAVSDSQPLVKIAVWGEKGKRSDIGAVRFDMAQEKIVKPESAMMFSKQLQGCKGVLHYKFINLKTRTLTPQEFELAKTKKSQVELQLQRDEKEEKVGELMALVEKQAAMLRKLQKETKELISDNLRKNSELEFSRSHSKNKQINLKIKINPGENLLKRENEELKHSLAQQTQHIYDLEDKLETLRQQKEMKELELKKTFERLEQLGEQYRSNFTGKNSSLEKQRFLSGIDPVEQLQVLPSSSPTRISIRQPKAKRSTVKVNYEESMVGKIKKGDDEMRSQSLQREDDIHLTVSNYNPSPDTKLSQMRRSELRPLELKQPKKPLPDHQIQQRISVQKQDHKWNSLYFQQRGQVDMLKRQIQLQTKQNKQSEKELEEVKTKLEEVKANLKRKEVEVRQLRRGSRKNLHIEGRPIKDKNEFELQLMKVQDQHDCQKIALQQDLDRVEKECSQKRSELKALKLSAEYTEARLKTFEERYNQLRTFNKKLSEDMIEFKQKAGQYDLTLARNKVLQADNQSLLGKNQLLTAEAAKYEELYMKAAGKLKNSQKDLERLRKVEREYGYLQNQNGVFKKSIESYERRLEDIKRYCLKFEDQSKAIMAKRRNPSQAQNHSSSMLQVSSPAQQKQMKQKFSELNKKIQDFETNMLLQQIEDLKAEAEFVQQYYEVKKVQEREKAWEAKEGTEKDRDEAVKNKDAELNQVRDSVLKEIHQKVALLQQAYAELRDRISNGCETFIATGPQKFKKLEQKLSALMQKDQMRENERKVLKETITDMKKDLNSSSGTFSELKKSKNSSQNQLLKSMIAKESQNRQKFLEETRLKNEAVREKVFQENKKVGELMKQVFQLRHQRDKFKREVETSARNAQNNQKKLEQAWRKAERELKNDINKLTEQNEKLTQLCQKAKNQAEDLRLNVEKLTEELEKVSAEVSDRDHRIGLLNQTIDKLQDSMRECEKAERKMRHQVDQMKDHAQFTQKQYGVLFENRCQEFVKIERIKEAQLSHYRQAVKQLQGQLQSQLAENFTLIEQNQSLRDQLSQTQSKMLTFEQQSQLQLQSKNSALDEYYSRWQSAEKESNVLKTNILEISKEFETMEMSTGELYFKLQSMQKQLQTHEKKDRDFEQLQIQLREQLTHQNLSIQDKVYKLKLYEEKYMRIRTEVQLAQKENDRLSTLSLTNSDFIEDLQAKVAAKVQQVLLLKEERSRLEIQLKRMEFTAERMEVENEDARMRNLELEAQMQKMAELVKLGENSKIGEGLNRSMVRQNKKVPNIDLSRLQKDASRMDNSRVQPQRAVKIPRRAQTFQTHDLSGFNFGGITPIPSAPPAFIRRDSESKEEIQMKRRTSREIPEQVKSKQNETLINITLEQDQSPQGSNRLLPALPPEAEAKIPGTINFEPLILKANQEHSRPGPNNYQFEERDSEYGESNVLIAEYEDKLKAFQQQLMLAFEENQLLKSQNAELHQKLEETARIGLKNSDKPAETLGIQPSKEQELGAQSHRKGRSNSFRTSRDIPNHESLNTSKDQRQRSQTGAIAPQHKYQELQQKYESAQIELQQMYDQVQNLKMQLESQAKQQQLLIEETENYAEDMEQLNNQLKEARFEVEQSRQYQTFQVLYEQERQRVASCLSKIEELAGEILSKEEVIASLNLESTENMQKLSQEKADADKLELEKQGAESKVKELQTCIRKMKNEFRRYEEESELEIVKLREEIELKNAELHAKSQQIQNLVEKYLELEEEKDQLAIRLTQTRQSVAVKDEQLAKSKQTQLKVSEQVTKNEQSKQNLLKTIKQLQVQLLEKGELIRTITSEHSMTSKKYEIRLQTDRSEMAALGQKLAERERVVGLLKKEIGLYNEECSELKKANESLNAELGKVEKELKDILQVYEREIAELRMQADGKGKELLQISQLMKAKDSEITVLAKQLRTTQKQRDYARAEVLEHQSTCEKIKQIKNRQLGQIQTKLQFSINQCEKLKATLRKTKEQLDCKQTELKDLTEKSLQKSKLSKKKYERYEQIIEDFSSELKKIEERPSSQAHEQILFENELLHNQIAELKQQLSKASSKVKQEHIYLEFRKYKANKQREIQDLEAEMEKYGGKINELEQGLFLMKRENQALIRTNAQLTEEKEELEGQCQNEKEEVAEVLKELEFYKKRKMLDMQKLLNDTQ